MILHTKKIVHSPFHAIFALFDKYVPITCHGRNIFFSRSIQSSFDSFILLARAFRWQYYSKNRIYLILSLTNKNIVKWTLEFLAFWLASWHVFNHSDDSIIRIFISKTMWMVVQASSYWNSMQIVCMSSEHKHIICVSLTEIRFIVRACQLLNCSLSVSYKCYWHI